MVAERLRVGVIGASVASRLHLPGFHLAPDVEVVALCGTSETTTAALASEFGIPRHHTDFRRVLADPDIQAVAVAMPPHQHHQIVVAALLAGKHVLCEQPLARTVAEARDMVRQADVARVVHMVNYPYRWLPAPRRIQALLADGYIGAPRAISVTHFRDMPTDLLGLARSWLLDRDRGGGMLNVLGSAIIDTLLWWFGPIVGVAGRLSTTMPERRDARTGATWSVTADDTCVVTVEFATGALASLHLSGAARYGSGDRLEIYGSEGTLVLDNDGTLRGARGRDRAPRPIPVPATNDPTLPADTSPMLAGFVRLARAFVDAIQAGQPRPPTFADGLRVQEVIGAAQKSSQDGQWATLGARPRDARPPRNPLRA